MRQGWDYFVFCLPSSSPGEGSVILSSPGDIPSADREYKVCGDNGGCCFGAVVGSIRTFLGTLFFLGCESRLAPCEIPCDPCVAHTQDLRTPARLGPRRGGLSAGGCAPVGGGLIRPRAPRTGHDDVCDPGQGPGSRSMCRSTKWRSHLSAGVSRYFWPQALPSRAYCFSTVLMVGSSSPPYPAHPRYFVSIMTIIHSLTAAGGQPISSLSGVATIRRRRPAQQKRHCCGTDLK